MKPGAKIWPNQKPTTKIAEGTPTRNQSTPRLGERPLWVSGGETMRGGYVLSPTTSHVEGLLMKYAGSTASSGRIVVSPLKLCAISASG